MRAHGSMNWIVSMDEENEREKRYALFRMATAAVTRIIASRYQAMRATSSP